MNLCLVLVGDVVGSRIWPDMKRTRVPIVNNTTIVELLNKIVLLSIFCIQLEGKCVCKQHTTRDVMEGGYRGRHAMLQQSHFSQ